jgi:hypothetical protein
MSNVDVTRVANALNLGQFDSGGRNWTERLPIQFGWLARINSAVLWAIGPSLGNGIIVRLEQFFLAVLRGPSQKYLRIS